MPENEYEVPEVPDVDESEATEGPWDWATDLDPDTVRETYENVTAMRRSADEKYRAAAEERQYAEQMMARAQQQPEPTSHQNSHAESDLYSSLDETDQRTQQEIQQMRQEMQQMREYQATQAWNQGFDGAVTNAQEIVNEYKGVTDLYGGARDAAASYVQRAVSERIPLEHSGRIMERARELAKGDHDRIEGLVRSRLEAVSKAKAQGQSDSTPPPRGPQVSRRSTPRGSEPRKADMARRGVDTDGEIAEFQRIVREAE